MEEPNHTTPARDIDYGSDEKSERYDVEVQPATGTLTRALKGRHMQMIAIGTYSI